VDKWKIVSEKSILKSRFFEVKEQEVALPDNKKRVYQTVERLPTVNIFPILSNDKIYLISQYRPMFGKRILEAIAGHVEENETTLAGAKRELKEEVGITAFQWEEIARIQKSASIIKETAHIFLAQDLELGEAQPDEGEDIALIKLSLAEAMEKVVSGEINDAVTMIGIFMLDRLKREKKL